MKFAALSILDRETTAQNNGFKDAAHMDLAIEKIKDLVRGFTHDMDGKEGIHTNSYLFAISMLLGSALHIVMTKAPHGYDTFIRQLLDTIDAARYTTDMQIIGDKEEPTPPAGELN